MHKQLIDLLASCAVGAVNLITNVVVFTPNVALLVDPNIVLLVAPNNVVLLVAQNVTLLFALNVVGGITILFQSYV